MSGLEGVFTSYLHQIIIMIMNRFRGFVPVVCVSCQSTIVLNASISNPTLSISDCLYVPAITLPDTACQKLKSLPAHSASLLSLCLELSSPSVSLFIQYTLLPMPYPLSDQGGTVKWRNVLSYLNSHTMKRYEL